MHSQQHSQQHSQKILFDFHEEKSILLIKEIIVYYHVNV